MQKLLLHRIFNLSFFPLTHNNIFHNDISSFSKVFHKVAFLFEKPQYIHTYAQQQKMWNVLEVEKSIYSKFHSKPKSWNGLKIKVPNTILKVNSIHIYTKFEYSPWQWKCICMFKNAHFFKVWCYAIFKLK